MNSGPDSNCYKCTETLGPWERYWQHSIFNTSLISKRTMTSLRARFPFSIMLQQYICIAKPVLSGHSKIDKTKVLKPIGF